MNEESSQPGIQSSQSRQVVVASERAPTLSVLNGFVETKAYQFFVDLCEFCQQARVVGVCWGVTGAFMGRLFLQGLGRLSHPKFQGVKEAKETAQIAQ